MKSILIFFLLSVSFVCHAQNFLIIGETSFTFSIDSLTAGLDALGYPYTVIFNTALTSSDFDGIDVFIDAAINTDSTCGGYYTLSIPAIQEFLDNGGATFFMLENGQNFYNCNQQKIENVINPYITSPITSSTVAETRTDCFMASVLPDDKFCVLDTPNDIAGRSFECNWLDNFDGSIDSDSVLAFDNTAEVAAIYGGSDVVVPNGRYIVWTDVDHEMYGPDLVIFENMMDYLISGCCDTTTECDGLECGTGACGGDCPNLCDSTEFCDVNTCVCDTTIECNGLECGTGFCGGDCLDTCSESEVCIVNSCEHFFTVPSSASKWSIYHTGCIKWNVDALQETHGDIYLEYGMDDGPSKMKEIVSSFDLTSGEYEWMIYGCFPGTVRIVIIYSVSGDVQVSKDFTLWSPSTRFAHTC